MKINTTYTWNSEDIGLGLKLSFSFFIDQMSGYKEKKYMIVKDFSDLPCFLDLDTMKLDQRFNNFEEIATFLTLKNISPVYGINELSLQEKMAKELL